MVSPLFLPPVNDDALVTPTPKSGRSSCSCHIRHDNFLHKKLSNVSTPLRKITLTNEEEHRKEYYGRMMEENDEMTFSHSQVICPHDKITSRSQSSSSYTLLEKCSEISGDRRSSRNELINMTGINCERCFAPKMESLSRNDRICWIPTSSKSHSCTICEQSDGCVTGLRSNNKNNDKNLVKNYCSCAISYESSSVYINSQDVQISTRYFTNGMRTDYDKVGDKTNDFGGSWDHLSKSILETRGDLRRETRRIIGVDRRVWLFCASLLFLSLVGPAYSYSVFGEEDEDFDVGISHYASRYRRSAEQFSSLHDALSLIPSNYSIHEPPPTNNSEATQVDFSVLIMNVRDIKELNEGYGDLELSLEMNLRIYWKDTRLSHLADRSGNKFIVLNPVLLDKLWHPDIFIDHVKGVAQPALISKPASLRVYPDSSVRYSARITVTMACQMDFHYYPADTQRCSVDMKSYAYSSRILALDWREGKGALLVEYLELPNFDVALDTTQNFMVNTSSGSYSGIRFTILLRRKLSYHLIQTYLPSTLFIIVSWLSFLVPPESVPGRMALCMTTLLTLTAMFSAVRQNTPNVSYVKALDIWMVVCIIFVFLTLVEYTVLLKLKSKKSKPAPPVSAHPPERVAASAQTSHQQPPPTTRWTIPSLQYTSDSAKFRGCKTTDGVISENGSGTNGEMRHRENGGGGENGAASGDNVNISTINIPPLVAPHSAHPSPLPSPPPPPPPPPQYLGPGDRPLNKYELAAKKIEKFTSAVIPTLFVIFQFIYWPWLINSSEYYNQDKSTTFFKSM